MIIEDPNDPCLHEEIFGPVLSIHVVRDDDAAIKIENDSPYGYVWSPLFYRFI